MNHKHLGQISCLILAILFLAACAASQPTPTVVPTMAPPAVDVTSDMIYATSLQEEGVSWMLDVYTPDEAGNWPVIVFMHGLNATKEGEEYIRYSQTIAEHGAVVYTINWPTWNIDLAEKENGKGFRETSEVLFCAIRFA